jgi:hypothetical protein
MLVALAYYFYGYASAERRLRATCALIQPGASLPELAVFARDHGLSEPHALYNPTYLMETRTFGRYGCRVEIEGDHVRTSTYVFRG